MKFFLKCAVCAVATASSIFLSSTAASAEISLTGATATENFDGIGTSGTAALPSGWVMSAAGVTTPTYTAVGNLTAVSIAASSGSPATGGRYNWGNGTTTSDRAIGFMTSGSYASPNSVMAGYVNNTGGTITDLTLAFDYERYRINTAAAAITFFYSTDGSTWTAVTSGDSGSFSTGTSAYAFTGGTVVSKSGVTITGLSIAAGGKFYLRWNFNTTGANSQGLGLDNFSLTATLTGGCTSPTSFSVTGGGSFCSGGSGVAIGLADSEVGMNYQLFRAGTVAVGSFVAGTGEAISFGDQTIDGTYTVVATNTVGNCTNGMTGSAIVMVVPTVTPSVGISANPGTTTCGGNTVIFTATPTNGGATPHFQWKLNGNDVGVDSASYTNNALLNGDQISAVLTTSVACATAPTATSATLTMNITASVTPAVSVSASPGTNICAGTTVIFTATPVNGGSLPNYVWKTNGVQDTSVPSSSATYTNSTLANANTVDCQLISNDPCASPTTVDATQLAFTVNPTLTPSVSVAPDVGTTICAGTTVIFTATPVNGGASPFYQWKTNGVNVGLNNASYTNAALINGTIVTVILTPSAEICVSTATATSSDVTMTVNASPSLAGPTNASRCEGAAVTFTVTAAGLGPFTYQWKKDGVNITDATNTSYTIASVTAADYANTPGYQCLVTSNASGCSTLSAAATLSAASAPSLTGPFSATKCVGQSVTFGIGATGTLTYQWRKNGTPISGATASNYTISAIAPGDAADYDCMVTNTTTGCGAGSSTATLSIGTGCTVSSVVIVEAYGGGGNSGATFRNDFIGLFNRGCDTVNLSGWSVQYASASGTTWQVTPLSGSIPPGGYYLVQEAQGGGGTTSLPTPDATGTISMGATDFKVALVSSTTALSGACPSSSSIMDLIGLGTANCSEGSASLPASNTLSAQRKNGGCTDTDNNASDFATGAPNPRNSSTTQTPCAVKPTAIVRSSDSTTICSNSVTTIRADLTGIAPFTVTWSDGTTTTTHTSVSGPTDSLIVSPISTKTYTITAVTDSGACPNGTGTFSATITIDNPPVSPNSTNAVTKNVPLILNITKLLNKASDPDAGDTLSIVSVTDGSHGTAVITPTNTIAYTPAIDYTGPDTFTYTISDGRTCTVTPTMAVTVVPPTTNEGFNRVSITTLPNNDVKLTFLGIPGYSYALDWAHELSATTVWEPLITNQASGTGLLLFTNTPSSPGPDFYRTRHVP